MSEKELIEKLLAENRKLKAKLKPKKSYVLENAEQFESLIGVLKEFSSGDSERYFFERKTQKGDGDEVVFKLNLLVADLIEFKARANVEEDQVNARISMDKGALIRFLQQGRIQRPRKPAKRKTKSKANAKKKNATNNALESLKEISNMVSEKIEEKRQVIEPVALPSMDQSQRSEGLPPLQGAEGLPNLTTH